MGFSVFFFLFFFLVSSFADGSSLFPSPIFIFYLFFGRSVNGTTLTIRPETRLIDAAGESRRSAQPRLPMLHADNGQLTTWLPPGRSGEIQKRFPPPYVLFRRRERNGVSGREPVASCCGTPPLPWRCSVCLCLCVCVTGPVMPIGHN